ncbi:MAG: dTDP-4-dehydrorhamnose reductase [Candidatus Omnitrophota bacterium]
MPEKYKVLIIGSSGMLGVDLCKELGGKYELYGIDSRTSAICDLAQKFIKCDITDAKFVSEAVLKVKPRVVIHTAALTDVDGCERDKEKAYLVNCIGTKNVAAACKDAGAALIYISTDFVFDGKKKQPYNETDETNPLNVYAESKLRGEDAVRETLKDHFILRTSWLYGKHGKNFVDTIITKAGTEKELKVVDDQVGSPTYTGDLAKAIHKLLDKAVLSHGPEVRGQGTYHVSNSGSVSWYGYAGEILKLMGSGTKIVPITSQELGRPANRPAMSVMDGSKFAEFTGHKMRDWKLALQEYVIKREGRDA